MGRTTIAVRLKPEENRLGEQVVRIRITKERSIVYWALNLSIAEKYFNENGNKDAQNWIRRSYRDYKTYNDRIYHAYLQTEDAVKYFEGLDQSYSAADVRDYVEQGGRPDKLLPYFVQHCKQRRKDAGEDLSKITTVSRYEGTLKILRNYLREIHKVPAEVPDEELDNAYWPLVKFDKKTVLELKAWLDKKYATNSVNTYLRNLRHVLYQAAEANLVSLDKFPMRGVSMPIKRKKVDRLHEGEIEQLATAPDVRRRNVGSFLPVTDTSHARPLALIMYLAHGARISDALNWRVNNYIVEGNQHRLRYKTGKNKKELSVLLTEDAQKLLEPYLIDEAGQPKKSTEFLFPYLPANYDKMSVNERFAELRRARARAYAQLTRLGERIGLTKHLTPHIMRHSFADMLRRAGVDLETTQMALGHSDVSTTRNYREQFDQEAVDTVSSLYQNRKKPEE
jgi:integrase